MATDVREWEVKKQSCKFIFEKRRSEARAMGRKGLPRVTLENFREGDLVWALIDEDVWWPVCI